MAFEFTDANFKETVTANEISVVDFWAEWCGPCRMVGPIVDEVAGEYEGKATIGKLNVDHNPNVSMEFGVRSIPTILFFKGGELFHKHVGTITKQKFVDKLEEMTALA